MPESKINVFMLRMLKSVRPSTGAAGQAIVVVHRPFVSLIPEIRSVFKGDQGIQVLTDRRISERRTRDDPVALDRRQTERRERQAELLEVVFRA